MTLPACTTASCKGGSTTTGASTSPGCSTSCGGSTGTSRGGPAASSNGSDVGKDVRWAGWPRSPGDLRGCSRTGVSAHVLMAGQWEPDEPRGSSPVLREPGGAIPPGYSPVPARVGHQGRRRRPPRGDHRGLVHDGPAPIA